ncbi:MAG: hypothetical protein ACYDBB_24665 [Armatimonadota bacterium]
MRYFVVRTFVVLTLLFFSYPATAAPADWQATRKTELYTRLLNDTKLPDRYRVMPLLDSNDPALIKRGNAGLLQVKLAGSFQGLILLTAYTRFHDKLELPTIAHIREQLSKELSEENGWPLPWTNWLKSADSIKAPSNNQGYYAIAMGVVGGEILGKPEIVAAGRTMLRNAITNLSQEGDELEFNSPGYTVVSMTCLATLAALADDAECRQLARWQRDRLLLMALLRYHPQSNQVAGPSARTYADDHLGAGCIINILLNDCILPAGVFTDEQVGNVYHPGYPYPWQHVNPLFAWDIPDYLRRMGSDKPMPYTVVSTVTDRGWNWPLGEKKYRVHRGGWRELTTYLTPDYALGTASGMYQFQYGGTYFLAHWPLAKGINSLADLRMCWLQYDFADRDPYYDKPHIRRKDIFRTLQVKNKAIVLLQPRDEGVPITASVMKMELILTAFRPVEELYLDTQRIDLSNLPVDIPEIMPFYLRDGSVYACVLPLEVSNLGRGAAMRINMDADHQLIISYYNYRGAQRTFSLAELPKIRNGIAFEIAGQREYPSLAAFRAHMDQAQLTDTMEAEERAVTFHSGNDALEIRYNPATETDILREINGNQVRYGPELRQDGKYAFVQSPYAILATGGSMTLGRSTLEWTPTGEGIWLLKDPKQEDYAVWNLSGEKVALKWRTPVGVIKADNFGFGRLLLQNSPTPTLYVEEFPGAQAQIKVEQATRAIRVVRTETADHAINPSPRVTDK